MRMSQLSRPLALVGVSAALALGSVLVGASAFGDDEPAKPTPRASAAPHHRGPGLGAGMVLGMDAEALSARVGALPRALREDLAEVLTTEDAGERAELIDAMREKAESGDYGDEVKNLLTRTKKLGEGLKERAKGSWSDLPQALKDDLAKLKDLRGEERKAALAKIMEKAKAGDYGDDVKGKADQLGRFGGFGMRGHAREDA